MLCPLSYFSLNSATHSSKNFSTETPTQEQQPVWPHGGHMFERHDTKMVKIFCPLLWPNGSPVANRHQFFTFFVPCDF